MSARSLFLFACASAAAILGAIPLSWALNEPSHKLVNGEAASQSTLDTYLRERLGMPDGIDTPLQARSGSMPVVEWLGLGGASEDAGGLMALVSGRGRFFRHFHDPLQPWVEGDDHEIITYSTCGPTGTSAAPASVPRRGPSARPATPRARRLLPRGLGVAWRQRPSGPIPTLPEAVLCRPGPARVPRADRPAAAPQPPRPRPLRRGAF